VAAHASFAEIISGFFAVELNVRVVAGDTAQSSFARGPAAAHLKLLKLIQRNEMSSFDGRANGKYINDIAERRTGPKVEIILAGLENASITSKVALRADVVPNFRPQPLGIDDGKVQRSFARSILLAPLRMNGPWAVTALAPDRQEAERRILKAVVTVRNWQRQARVAVNTQVDHPTRETSECTYIVARR
jgi:hypothetical protein